MLQRNTQAGEFYRMRAPSIEFEAGAQHKTYMDIILQRRSARHRTHIAFEEALSATPLDENGALAVAENPFKNKDRTVIDLRHVRQQQRAHRGCRLGACSDRAPFIERAHDVGFPGLQHRD